MARSFHIFSFAEILILSMVSFHVRSGWSNDVMSMGKSGKILSLGRVAELLILLMVFF